jgi:4-oxalocrotonate tautomerase
MREIINVPENDKFQVITEHPAEGLNIADNYLGNTYSKDIVIIQITMNTGRTVEMKKAFFKRIADDIHAQLKLKRDDVVINLVECVKENWSFGGGIAQYAE